MRSCSFYCVLCLVSVCLMHCSSYKITCSWCETWSLTLKDEHRLRVFENRVLRGIFGPKRDEVTGEWRRLHSGELHNL
jgi:hypothetical protein